MIPMYLYHYTSVDALKKIIYSSEIRFSSLAGLNDPYEGAVSIPENDFKKKLVYVSCWNAQEEEEINLWYMYAKMEGVRIKMKVPMFGNGSMRLDPHIDCHIPVVPIDPIRIPYTRGTQNEEAKILKVYGPIRIRYMDSEQLPNDVRSSLSGETVSLKEVALRKDKAWGFENEWRFKIILFSQVPRQDEKKLEVTPYIFVPFDKQCIQEILTAPDTDNRIISDIKGFLRKQNLTIAVNKSELRFAKKY